MPLDVRVKGLIGTLKGSLLGIPLNTGYYSTTRIGFYMNFFKQISSYLVILLFGFISAVFVHVNYKSELDIVRNNYVKEQQLEAGLISDSIEDVFQEIYTNVRTIGRLPGVRMIDRYGRNMSADADQAIQEIYNNLASSISISEIYIVPVEFNPANIDELTGEPEAPIKMYDQLIVGKSALSLSGAEDTLIDDYEVEEIEIYEYLLLEKQIAWLKANYPREDDFEGFNYPAITGEEVITCDNTRYDPKNPVEKDRSGIVLSVPFYDLNGDIKGVVSAIVLSSVIGGLLPSSNYTLRNTSIGYEIDPRAHQLSKLQDKVVSSENMPYLPSTVGDKIFEQVVSVAIADSKYKWELLASVPDSEFWERKDVLEIKQYNVINYTFVAIIQFLLLVAFYSLRKNQRLIRNANRELEEQVAERTKELAIEKDEAIVLRQKAEDMAEERSIFLANMSHEIRTPMNGVLGTINLLMKDSLSEKQLHYAKLAESSAKSLLVIINDILDFSKIEAGKLDIELIDFDLRKEMGDIAESMALRAQNKNLEMVLDLTRLESSMVVGDPGRIRQILVNVIGNAIKFTQKGEVLIRASLEEESTSEVSFLCSISDTGVGIPESKIASLFKSFSQVDASTTRKYGGTGLGLTIVKQLCELMDGSIDVSSEVGVGSQFNIKLKLQRSAKSVPVLPLVDIRDTPILIVDDNATNREVLSGQLKFWGAKVTEATGGEMALSLLDEHYAQTKSSFTIAILDMQMPGMDGAMLGQTIRKDGRFDSMKMIMMTSMDDVGDTDYFSSLGFSAYFRKPATTKDLFSAIEVLVDGGDALTSSEILTQQRMAHFPHPHLNPEAKILLVEDTEINQIVVKGLLENLGLSADLAVDGLQAIDMLSNTHSKEPYTLILMDCQMPNMDGYEACKLIRSGAAGESHQRVPIIAMTANTMKGDEEVCIAAGMSDYIGKPIDPSVLEERLYHWLKQY